MPPTEAASAPVDRNKSRHKDRRMVAFRTDVYQMATLLALRGSRDLTRQVRIVMIAALREAGLWPPTPELIAEMERLRAEQE